MVSERVLYDESPGIIPARWLDQAETEIRALTTSDTPAFRALRLDALRLHPEAFVPTYEEERAADSRSVASRFRDDWIHGGNFILGAYREGWLVGAVGVKRWPRQKQRHKATIWIMYTHADFRGKGTGRILLDAALERCREDPEIELVHLSVSGDSPAARNLYRSAGFHTYGIEPRALKIDDGHYVDVEQMVLDVKNVDYQISTGWHQTDVDTIVVGQRKSFPEFSPNQSRKPRRPSIGRRGFRSNERLDASPNRAGQSIVVRARSELLG